MDKLKHRIGYTSLFFSTVYNKAYYITSALTIALTLEFITTVNTGINNTILYWLALIIYAVIMGILYTACRKHKKKHNKLEVKQLKVSYISLRLFIMLIYTAVATVIISVIHIGIMLLTLK